MAGEYNRGVDPELEAILRMLDEVTEEVKSIRIEIDDDYLHAIELAEALPQNQSGTDKSWVAEADRQFRDHYKRARRIR